MTGLCAVGSWMTYLCRRLTWHLSRACRWGSGGQQSGGLLKRQHSAAMTGVESSYAKAHPMSQRGKPTVCGISGAGLTSVGDRLGV